MVDHREGRLSAGNLTSGAAEQLVDLVPLARLGGQLPRGDGGAGGLGVGPAGERGRWCGRRPGSGALARVRLL